jgi:hypothetical protein
MTAAGTLCEFYPIDDYPTIAKLHSNSLCSTECAPVNGRIVASYETDPAILPEPSVTVSHICTAIKEDSIDSTTAIFSLHPECVRYGVAANKGGREYMEDAHSIVENIASLCSRPVNLPSPCYFFGVSNPAILRNPVHFFLLTGVV